MSRIGVVVPTVVGRTAMLAQTVEAFNKPTSHEVRVVVPPAMATVGEAWNAGALRLLDVDYLFFAVDDAEPHAGWAEAAVWMCEAGFLPAARLVRPGGSVEACGSMGEGRVLPDVEDGTPCRQSGLPFLPRHVFEEVGEFLPIHFYVDDEFYARAARLGFEVQVCRGLTLTHYGLQESGVQASAMLHRQVYLDSVAALTPGG